MREQTPLLRTLLGEEKTCETVVEVSRLRDKEVMPMNTFIIFTKCIQNALFCSNNT